MLPADVQISSSLSPLPPQELSLSRYITKVCILVLTVDICLLWKTYELITHFLLGRNRGLLELDLKLDDLLEMQQNNHDELDLEYVQFNVPKVLALLNKRFARKKW